MPDILLFFLFISSSGLLASERFRQNRLAVVVAGLIAMLSTVFLFTDLWQEGIHALDAISSL
jgi:hypothetical protein